VKATHFKVAVELDGDGFDAPKTDAINCSPKRFLSIFYKPLSIQKRWYF
jgi:hypothetical protein